MFDSQVVPTLERSDQHDRSMCTGFKMANINIAMLETLLNKEAKIITD